MPARLLHPLLLLALLAGVVFATPALARDASPRPAASEGPNPLEGVKLYVDQESPSQLAWKSLRRAGKTRQADLIWKIAREPKAVWVGTFTRPNFAVKVRRIIDSAKAQGAVPVMTVLRAESNSCSPGYTGGGQAEDVATRAWYDDLARVIGNERVVIAYEPDSLGTIDCLARSRRDDRLRLLRYGVETLSRRPNVSLYLEAGASDWESVRKTVKKLKAIGIAKARGFMLNATHYDWTRNNIRHGLAISRRTGGKHFIINTAENGRGPVHYRVANGRRINVWCAPGLRGMGPAPTTDTSHPKVDAYLWINRPGYGQSCVGQPIAWFLPRALSYVRYATSWEAPPKGTRYGHAKRFPLSAFGVPR